MKFNKTRQKQLCFFVAAWSVFLWFKVFPESRPERYSDSEYIFDFGVFVFPIIVLLAFLKEHSDGKGK
ncbi:hypothetical protein [uncultured Roseobacter sp.]|uniref:hypothetical protein n=1 Tax=uncultured Roseobacter sp. TaxID=114847 RepID=UPI0026303012|nr:hypothetical protein [uncultured Roseobacter sp.]